MEGTQKCTPSVPMKHFVYFALNFMHYSRHTKLPSVSSHQQIRIIFQ
jgi:hypothetical protein